jgi:hypothetical protein
MTATAATKAKAATIKYWSLTRTFEVKEVENYMDLLPGQLVSSDTVRKMCADPDWNVKLISVDINIPIPVPIP